MAINIPIISEFSDAGVKAAKAAFQNFKTAVGDAQGGLNKFKAGSKVALDAVAANAGLFAVVGVAAFAKFAASGVSAFATLALESGKFADATGLAVEDASRWKEVAGDIGIGTDTLQTGIGKMNKVLGTSPELFKTLGIEVKKTKDGATDVNGTFLNVIERLKGIKDPAERAKVATQLLGKGWQSMAELINTGSVELTTSLRNVSNQQVISAEELQKAKDYRDATNDLGDAWTKLKYSAGQDLIPLVTGIVNVGTAIVDAFTSEDPLQFAKDQMNGYIQSAKDAREDTDLMKEAIKQARNPMKELATATDEVTVALENADTAWRVITGNFEVTTAMDDAREALGKMQEAAKEAFTTGAYDDLVAYNKLAADFMKQLEAIAGEMDGISSKEILFKFRTEGPAAALEYAGWLARGAEAGGLSTADALTLAGISTGSNNSIVRPARGARASGGPVAGGSTYLVGEKGPELFTPTSSGNITPNGGFGGGGNTITVNVNGGDPNSIVRALQQYVRQNGTLSLLTTTATRF
jgi:hypothetical protein